jgi:hypothetical protein
MMIARDAASVLNGLAQRRLEAPCATLISQGVFGHQAISLSTTAKPTLAYGWRTTTSHAEWAE